MSKLTKTPKDVRPVQLRLVAVAGKRVSDTAVMGPDGMRREVRVEFVD